MNNSITEVMDGQRSVTTSWALGDFYLAGRTGLVNTLPNLVPQFAAKLPTHRQIQIGYE
jgi:hypothetical protein